VAHRNRSYFYRFKSIFYIQKLDLNIQNWAATPREQPFQEKRRLHLPIPCRWPYLGLLTVPDSGFAALRQPADG
jgi:hypothetical protein